MSKEEFLNELEKNLKRLDSNECKKFLTYYEEMIEDYKENGYTEEDAVKKIGDPKEIAKEILGNQNSIKINIPTFNNKTLNTIFLLIGFPLWGSILLSAVLLLISLYTIIWCLPFATGASAIGFSVLSLVSIIGSPFVMIDTLPIGILQLGFGIASIGIAVLSAIVTIYFKNKFMIVTKNVNSKLSSIYKKKVVRL